MALQWIAADLRTGRVLADLPTLDVDWPLRRTIGQYDTGTAHLHLDGAPPDWQRAVMEGGAVLHCYDDDDDTLGLQWSGLVTSSTASSDTDVIDLSLVTGEGYFDRRYVGDVTYTQQGQNFIVADLVARFAADGVEPGLPVTTVYVTAGVGALRDRVFLDVDDTTVYTRLQQLASVLGGPEFTMTWQWSTDGLSILPRLLVGDRIGSAVPAGLGPAASFELPGSVDTAQVVRDFSAGHGANKVQALSSGQGDVRPTSGPVFAADFKGRPTFEHRWTPSTSVTNTDTLLGYARQALVLLAPGSQALTLTAALADAPRLGVDWQLGDDVGYQLGGLDQDGVDIVRAFPGGLAGVGRCIAYELTDSTITPILAATDLFVEAAA